MNCECNCQRIKKNSSTKSKILDQAWILFSNVSFFNLSMREIAQTLGLAKSALYYHFTNKTDLFRQVIENRLASFRSKLDIIFDKEIVASEKLKKITKIYVKETEREKKLIRLIYSDLPGFDQGIANLVNDFKMGIINKISLVIKDGIKKGEFKKNTDPYITAILLLNSIENTGKIINKDIFNDRAMSILLHGIQEEKNAQTN